MNYYNLKGLLATKKHITMKAPSDSFQFAPKRSEPFIEPTFKKEIFDCEKPSVILISAVGATGKTTLAQVLSSETRIPLLDLAKHKAVGDNTLTGLLTSAFDFAQLNEVFGGLATGECGIVIDGVDEGRAKTTEGAFNAFLDDIAKLCGNTSVTSFVLLGRTKTLEDCYLYLMDKGISVGLLSIDPFSVESARKYIDAFSNAQQSRYRTQYEQARDFILGRLQTVFIGSKQEKEPDFLNFIGYPPVLDAISTLLAKERDYYGLLQELDKGEGANTEVQLLRKIAEHILRREKALKVIPSILDPLIADLQDGMEIKASAFEPIEQCARLVAFALKKNLHIQTFSDKVINDRYEKQLMSFFQEHPFLVGDRFRNAVFESFALAALSASGNDDFVQLVIDYVRTHKYSYHFVYLLDLMVPGSEIPLKLTHVVMGAALEFRSVSSFVEISLMGPDPEDYQDGVAAAAPIDIEIEISFGDGGEKRKTFEFHAILRQGDEIVLNPRIAATFVRVPGNVVFEPAAEIELIAPVEIAAAQISFNSKTLVLRHSVPARDDQQVVFQSAEIMSTLESIVTNGVELIVLVPDMEGLSYPITQYTHQRPRSLNDPLLQEKVVRARRILVEFRSHSRGTMARYRFKIEQERVLRNDIGQRILDRFLRDGILTRSGNFYFLHPDKVNEHLGISWNTLRNLQNADRFLHYLREI